MEVICSPVLDAADIRALHKGLYYQEAQKSHLDEILRIPRDKRCTGLLTWAIATRRLELCVALLRGSTGQAIYHEKIGVLVTRDGPIISFEGSANESANGYVNNFERLVVHEALTTRSNTPLGEAICENFDQLWNNTTPGIEVVSLHEAIRRPALRAREDRMADTDNQTHSASVPVGPPETLRRPSRIELRPYQKEAIARWFGRSGIGIYSMATGTGKTLTALATAEDLFRRVGPPLVIIIVAPYLHLVRQWVDVSRTFGLDPINCSGPRSGWVGAVDAALFLVHARKRPILSLVTTNSTFAEGAFQDVLNHLQVRTLLIADEVHNLGAGALQKCLPNRVQLRLGLSATPERWMDEDGTAAIREYFGSVVFSLDLESALKLEPPVLTPYTYHPVLVDLEDDEREEYLRLTRLLARTIDSPHPENLSDAALGLLLKRARLIACARGKLPALARSIAPYTKTRYNLVYCGDGRVEVEALDARAAEGIPETEVLRQVEAVARLLGRQLEMNVATYTADTPDDERTELLRDFAAGHKNALVAIRCLDEGMDIPQVRRAFILASSTNPRQFIQRRGRVLRRADGKISAEIFDFVVVPPLNAVQSGTPEYRVLRNLVAKEMARVVEFARLAANGPQAHAKLLPILSALRLMHL